MSLHKLRTELGLKCKLIEAQDGVGGTWRFNRYPGAMSDTPSYLFRLSWDDERLRSYPWKNLYSEQPEALGYLEHVADLYDLRKDMSFNTTMTDAVFDEQHNFWRITTDKLGTVTGKYFITAVGPLSAVVWPDIPGLQNFKGEKYHTGNWPKEYDFTGKRVGVLGNGSTGVQVITALAPNVKQLTSFQRTPQYTVPAANAVVTPEFRAEVNKNYNQIWEDVQKSAMGMGFMEATESIFSVSDEERERRLEHAWHRGPAGGFFFMFGAFGDVLTDEKANAYLCDFIKRKISTIVKDPVKARKLTPPGIYARRPICDSGYFETFNRDNVDIVNLKETPIAEVVENGIRCADGTVYELDVLICATGFDSEGNYTRGRYVGRGGLELQKKWDQMPANYFGLFPAGFPNMACILGPLSAFLSAPPSEEAQLGFIMEVIKKAEGGTFEATEEAEEKYVAIANDVGQKLLFSKEPNWFYRQVSAKQKRQVPRFWLGGLAAYKELFAKCRDAGYSGIKFSRP